MAAATLDEVLAPLVEDPSRTAVLLDVDGTLAPIVRHADEAHVPEPIRSLLIDIAGRYRLVACVSGRRAADARRMVGLGTISYVGNHGAELLRSGQTQTEIPDEMKPWIRRIGEFHRRVQSELGLERLRIRSEDKALIFGYHWRGAPDVEAAERVIEELERQAQEAGLVTHRGRMVLEVRPAIPFDKGIGIGRLLAADAQIERGLYMGDDRTDADAFVELHAALADGRLKYAACIGVASHETPAEVEQGADVLVDGTEGVRAVLTQLARS